MNPFRVNDICETGELLEVNRKNIFLAALVFVHHSFYVVDIQGLLRRECPPRLYLPTCRFVVHHL